MTPSATTQATLTPRSDEWVTAAQARAMFGLPRSDRSLDLLWRSLAVRAEAGVDPVLDGVAIRLALCGTPAKSEWCVHRRHAPILANHVGEAAASDAAHMNPKPRDVSNPEEWVSYVRTANRLGLAAADIRLKTRWDEAIALAQARRPVVYGGSEVRFAAVPLQGVKRWCIHKDDLRLLDATIDRSTTGTLPKPGWLTSNEAYTLHGSGIDRGTFLAGWRKLVAANVKGEPSRIWDVDCRMTKAILYHDQRWLMRAEDAAAFAAAAARQPKPEPVRYVTHDAVVSRVVRGARGIAARMLADMAGDGRTLPSTGPDGEVPAVRMMEHKGRTIPCLRVDCVPAFMAEVTRRQDEALLRETAAIPVETEMDDFLGRPFGV